MLKVVLFVLLTLKDESSAKHCRRELDEEGNVNIQSPLSPVNTCSHTVR